MTSQAIQLEKALRALVSAVDAYQQHGRSNPRDRDGLCRLGVAVDENAKKLPPSLVRAVVRHLAEMTDESASTV